MFLPQTYTKYDPTLDPSFFSETVQNKMVVGSFNLMMYFQPNVKYMIKISSDHLLDCYLVVYIEKYCKIGPNKATFVGSGLKGRMHSYNGKKIQTGPRAFIFGYVIDLPKSYNF